MSLLFALGLEYPAGGGRTHRKELEAVLVTHMKMAMTLQRLNSRWKKRDRPLGTDVIGSSPGQVQCLLHL